MSPKIHANRHLMLRLSTWVPIAAFMSALCSFAPAMADDETLQEVVVTAQKRTENARDVPITMTVFNGNAIQAEGFTGLTDYAKFVPGMIYNGSGLGERSGPDIVIRGVANSRLFDFETNIGTNTTGFVYGDMPAYAFDPELIDVQRIEVLKGPQGTLYGASAMGGLVKVVPNLPDFTGFSAQVQGASRRWTRAGMPAATAGIFPPSSTLPYRTYWRCGFRSTRASIRAISTFI